MLRVEGRTADAQAGGDRQGTPESQLATIIFPIGSIFTALFFQWRWRDMVDVCIQSGVRALCCVLFHVDQGQADLFSPLG
ncbi:hypothetical protein BDV11DRAFT_189809 [Aspergillus similis]